MFSPQLRFLSQMNTAAVLLREGDCLLSLPAFQCGWGRSAASLPRHTHNLLKLISKSPSGTPITYWLKTFQLGICFKFISLYSFARNFYSCPKCLVLFSPKDMCLPNIDSAALLTFISIPAPPYHHLIGLLFLLPHWPAFKSPHSSQVCLHATTSRKPSVIITKLWYHLSLRTAVLGKYHPNFIHEQKEI